MIRSITDLPAGAITGVVECADGTVAQPDLVASNQAARHEVGRALPSGRDVVSLGSPLMAIRHDEDFASGQTGGSTDSQDGTVRMGGRWCSHQRSEDRKPREAWSLSHSKAHGTFLVGESNSCGKVLIYAFALWALDETFNAMEALIGSATPHKDSRIARKQNH